MSRLDAYITTLETLRNSANFRRIPSSFDTDATVNLSGNDYLGIAEGPLQQQFMEEQGDRLPAFTSSASRLLAASQEEYQLLEQQLSALYSDRKALLFNSGYHANTGLISALASEKGTLILADRLVHASIIDGIVLSKAPFKRFVHNDFARLETLLQRHSEEYDRILTVVESIYSMDGDSADIETLVSLKRKYPKMMLYVDEAHAFGVEGPHGLGLSRQWIDDVDVMVGTFGKAAASMGAFCITDNELLDYAVNRSRSLIFSTALPPVNCAWTRYVIDHMVDMDAERKHLKQLATTLHQGMTDLGLNTSNQPSHILPIIVGDSARTISLSAQLNEMGFKVLPIRTPTVPPGTERLRVSLSAALSTQSITDFSKALSSLKI